MCPEGNRCEDTGDNCRKNGVRPKRPTHRTSAAVNTALFGSYRPLPTSSLDNFQIACPHRAIIGLPSLVGRQNVVYYVHGFILRSQSAESRAIQFLAVISVGNGYFYRRTTFRRIDDRIAATDFSLSHREPFGTNVGHCPNMQDYQRFFNEQARGPVNRYTLN
jgi:hypothetical protein